MPTYDSNHTSVELTVVNLHKTTTADPKVHPGGNSRALARNAAEFARSSTQGALKELPIIQIDTRFDDNTPFFMVRAGVDLFNPSCDTNHTREPEQVPETEGTKAFGTHHLISHVSGHTAPGKSNLHSSSPKQEIRADDARKLPFGLCLTVSLSPDSFLPTRDTRSKKSIYDHVREKTTYNDVKIDVFFNGQLCGSTFVAERYHGERFEMTSHKVRFSGRRIGRMVEKPWVIVLPGQNGDATSREHHHRGEEVYAGAQPRWAAISEALEAEAERVGRDEFGVFSLLGKHLMTLANLGMPPEVEEMQKAGGPKFGVIDVVVIAGKGLKDDIKYGNLSEPAAFILKANKPEIRNDFKNAPNLTPKQSKQFTKNKSRQAGEKSDAEKAFAASRELFRIESDGHQQQDSLGDTSGTGSFGKVDKPGQVSSLKSDKHHDLSAYLSEKDNPIHSSGSPYLKKYLANHIGDSSWIKSFGAVGKPVQASTSKPDKQHDESAFPSSRNKPFGFPGFGRSRIGSHQTHRIADTPSLSIMGGLHVDESPRIPASHIGRAALVLSGSTSFTGLDRDENRTEDASIVQRPKHKKYMPYEYVLDDKMTLFEEFESVRAKAKSQSVERNEVERELRNPVSIKARASGSGVADRGASTLAGPSKAVDPKGDDPKPIVKSKPKGGPAPSTPIQIQPITSARTSNPVDTFMKDPETTGTGSPRSSLSSSSSISLMPPSHPVAAAPTKKTFKKSDASTKPVPFCGISGPAWDASWMTPPLSQDSVLTYAPDGLLRSIKTERNGWFKEKDVVMAVRFLVG